MTISDLEMTALFGDRISPTWAGEIAKELSSEAKLEASGEPAALGVKVLRDVRRILGEFEQGRESIATSNKLTPAGKADAYRRLGNAALEEMQKRVDRRVNHLRDKSEAARKDAALEPAIADAAERAIIFAHIWQSHAGTFADNLETEALARTALEIGDAVTFEAIAALPRAVYRGALTSEQLERLNVERLASAKPQLAGRIAHLNEIAADVEHVATIARQHFGEAHKPAPWLGTNRRGGAEGGKRSGDPLERMATGGAAAAE